MRRCPRRVYRPRRWLITAIDPADLKKGGSFEVIQEKKWDNTPEGRAAPRRHRRARRLQTGATPVPRRLLSKRWSDQERAGKKVDRQHARESRQRFRS